MGTPFGGPEDPDDAQRREHDTDPIPRERPGQDRPDDHPAAETGGGGERAGEWVRNSASGRPQPIITEEELAGLQAASQYRRVLPLEDEPTAFVARYLFPTERYRGEWRRHWTYLAVPIAVGIAATFVLGYLSGFLAGRDQGSLTTAAVIAWLAIMGWVGWRFLDWHFDRFVLTNKRVMVINGIITRNVAMMPLARVTDMKYEQSPTGRALNYGTFILESAGQDQALREIKHLPNPNELYLRVVEEMYEPTAVEARLGKEADEAKAEDA
ncbi:MAG TPA: PH domain-containing protein [Micromonosporaceae bacterium]